MPKTILVVDDYADCREFMKLLLVTFGYEILEAADGCEAVELVKHQIPDLILMDLAMPNMDGLTATRIIKSFDNGAAKVPIIAFTANSNSFRKEAIEQGFTDVLKKPVDNERLESLLNYYLAQT